MTFCYLIGHIVDTLDEIAEADDDDDNLDEVRDVAHDTQSDVLERIPDIAEQLERQALCFGEDAEEQRYADEELQHDHNPEDDARQQQEDVGSVARVQQFITLEDEGAYPGAHGPDDTLVQTAEQTVGQDDEHNLHDDDEQGQQHARDLGPQSVFLLQFLDFGLNHTEVVFGQFVARLSLPHAVEVAHTEQHHVARHDVGRELAVEDVHRIGAE